MKEQLNPSQMLEELRTGLEQTQKLAEVSAAAMLEAAEIVEHQLASTPIACAVAVNAMKRRASSWQMLADFCRVALASALFLLCLSSCGGMKSYRYTESVRAARVGDKSLQQWADNYVCPGCVKLPDLQVAHPGQWVIISGANYRIVENADFRRKYRKQ